MDDLLRHCMRELAFDGDLGCDISRLQSFIESFYAAQESPRIQKIDNHFHSFVWSLLVQQPSVRVGLVPQGGTVDVYIAPQHRTKKKVSKSKKKKLVPEPAPFPALDGQTLVEGDEETDTSLGSLQLIDGASTNSLDALIQQYGDGLRVAVDPETSIRAITGSHIRPAKLTPMVYTALQLISRGRESGLSVVDLGKKTSYDQKTCFYLVKQLCELDLVVKLSKGGPGGGNFCIHKYFFMTSPFWEGIRREGVAGEDGNEDPEQGAQSIEDGTMDTQKMLQFDPIDTRHLASVQLIKSRLLRLLKHSENGLHMYQNLLRSIGFVNPTRRDRRFFIIRIRELIKEGFIEKVVVPKVHGFSKTLCIRLVEDGRPTDSDGAIVQPVDIGDDEPEAPSPEDKERDMPVVNLTIHRQILKLLEEADHEGLTLNDISARLGNFDKRTIDLILSRLQRPPPPHLANLATCDFIENQGRERRHRHYTLPGYLSFVKRENIDHAGWTSQFTSWDLSHSGDFYALTPEMFYKDQASLAIFEDGYRAKTNPPKAGATRKLGRPRKDTIAPKLKKGVSEGAPDEQTPITNPRGKKAKATATVADAQKDGGESHAATQKVTQRGTKRKRDVHTGEGEDDVVSPPKKKGGRRPKKGVGQSDIGPSQADAKVGVATVPGPVKTLGSAPTKLQDVPLGRTTFDNTAELIQPLEQPGSSVSAASVPIVLEKVGTQQNNDHGVVTTEITVIMDPKPVPPPSNVPLLSTTTEDGRSSPRVPTDTATDAAPPGPKRAHSATLEDAKESEAPPPKRLKSSKRKERINLSQMLAENEFMRVVEACGGIANLSSKEFFDTHARILKTMVDAGESTSMPVGTQPDRRTIRKIFERLEERGRLKTLTATVAPRTGQPRPVNLAYELGVSQEKLDQYLTGLREGIPTLTVASHRKLDQPIDYTKTKARRTRDQDGVLQSGSENENWRHELDISSMDDDAIRSVMLSEGQTVAQLYGFLVGRARRARELHQFTLAHLQDQVQSTYIVSKSERIVAFPYYYNDLPISTYFAVVSAIAYSAELFALMGTPQGRQMLVKDLPMNLHDKLQVGRARSRDKLLGLLEILTSLKLVTPLQPSTSEAPFLTCDPNGTHPTRFDTAYIPEARYTASSPSYWQFNIVAPVYLYSMTNSWPPPFHRDMFVRTADESMPFWFELEDACLNKENMGSMTSAMDSITGPCLCTPEVVRGLRRRHSWISSYVLSWNQKQYLSRWTDPSTGYTPLSDADGGRSCLENVCDIISAPADAVYEFFTTSHSMFTKQMERIRERDRKRKEQHIDRKATEAKALLAEKAAQARRQLEADWDALLLRVYPGPKPYGSVSRLKQLRTQYLQSRTGMDNEKWEAEVLEVISGSRSGKRNTVLSVIASSIPRKATRRLGINQLPQVAAQQQKSVAELIERQKERVATIQATQKKKSKNEVSQDPDANTKTADPPRRQRFQWTSEYDELARDACAIIKCRCRTWHRMDWTALDQLFPFLPRNNVRQRIVTLRQEAGGESYLRLLEDKWHELWLEYRGTEALPDDDPSHPADFDAIVHVEFLRKYIDKRALRVGLTDSNVQSSTGAILPKTIPEFFSRWTVNDTQPLSNKMDVVWNAQGDEHREKAFLGEVFSLTRGAFDSRYALDTISNGVAQSGLKMALETPEEDYDVNNATLLLNNIGQDVVHQASKELLARGVISESGRVHKNSPGRKLKISSLNKDASGGSFHPDFYAEALNIEVMFEDETEAGDWREWSVIAADGDMAALVELVSSRKIEFHIDVSGPASQRPQLDWNSKKVDDDQIATALAVRFNSPNRAAPAGTSDSLRVSPTPPSMYMDVDETIPAEHGQNDGEPAPCRKTSQGIITCSACIDIDQQSFYAKMNPENRSLFSTLNGWLDSAGWNGLSREDLMQASLGQSQAIRTLIENMVSGPAPQCYWVGYKHPVLTSRLHIKEWAVSIPGLSRPRLVFPRRWLNIKGEIIEDVWNTGLRAVVGVLVVRPGISQVELRQRLISVYDRQELNDLLYHLCAEGFIEKRTSPENPDLQFTDIRAMNTAEERNTCWTLTWKPWYRVNE